MREYREGESVSIGTPRAVQELELAYAKTLRDMRAMIRKKYNLDRNDDLIASGAALCNVGILALCRGLGCPECSILQIRGEVIDYINHRVIDEAEAR